MVGASSIPHLTRTKLLWNLWHIQSDSMAWKITCGLKANLAPESIGMGISAAFTLR
jgi:hypothetical protein